MIEFVKAKLLEDPEKIKQYLEHFDFHHIVIRTNYMSFGRSADSSPKSIVIRLKNNDTLLVKDYPRNVACDLFKYVMKARSVSFREAFSEAKDILGIDGYYYQERRSKQPFGGFYEGMRSKKDVELKIYDDSILDEYISCGNDRFLRDGISLEAQRYFQIGYSVKDQAITIPIWNEVGQLVGVKARIPRDPGEDEQKYYYLVPCSMSQTLYGYSQNYEYLESTDVVYVAEAEKTVMAAYSYGVKNIVSIGGSNISKKQVQLLLSLNAKKIVLLHDNLFDYQGIERNIQMIRGYSKFREVKIGYWNYFDKNYEGKISPTDLGREKFLDILENEIKWEE